MRALPLMFLLALAACKDDVQQQIVDPVALTPEATGHFCQMNLLEHEGPKAQIHLEGLPGAPLFFSQVRDAVAYMRLPEQTHRILAVWVNDMGAPGADWADPGAENWIALDSAQFVIGSRRDGGMGAPEIVPFADTAAAQAFMAANGGTLVALDDIPDSALIAPVQIGDDTEDDADFDRRLQSLSNRNEG